MNLTFTATLDTNSLNKLIKDLQYYKNHVLPERCKAFVKELAARGVEIAKVEIFDFPAVFTGELLNSISAYEPTSSSKDVVKAIVRSDSEHAIYVEMGTGTVGASHPYPGKLPAVYAQGEKMFYTEDGRYGWIYRNENDGKYYFTEGMPSRPFMYNTTLRLVEEINSIARQIFWR